MCSAVCALDSDTHLPSHWTILHERQSDPELRELSPMRSGLAVRGGKSHWPVNERNLPCCFVALPRLLEPGTLRETAKRK